MTRANIKSVLDSAAILFALCLLVAACVAALSGCAAQTDQPEPPAEEPTPHQPDACEYRITGDEYTLPAGVCWELRYFDCVGQTDCRQLVGPVTAEVRWVGYGATLDLRVVECGSAVCL